MRLLLVEDDEILRWFGCRFKMEGYAVDWLTNGKLAMRL